MISNTRFKSEIDGKTLKDYKSKINWDIKELDRRIVSIEDILNLDELGLSKDEFWQEVWDCGICKSVLNKTDARWEETDVSQFLALVGTYLIYGYNKKEKRNNDLEINSDITFDDVIDDGNYRLAPPNKIEQSDYRVRELFAGTYEDYCSKVSKTPYEIKSEESFNRIKHNEEEKVKLLTDARYNLNILKEQNELIKKGNILQYNNVKELVLPMHNIQIPLSTQLARYGLDNEEMIEIESQYKTIVKKTSLALYHITDNLKSQKDYMISCKLAYTNRVMINPPKCPNVKCALDVIDYFDPTHIKGMLMLGKRALDPSSDMAVIAYDINKKVKELYSNGILSDRDLYIIEGIQFNVTYKQMGRELGIKFQNVDKAITRICNQIADSFYQDHLDLYFLNESKGRYKKCNKCGEVKRLSQFDRKSDNKDGYKNNCKKCNKK